MRVTQEADYAIRMCCALNESGEVLDTGRLSEIVSITKPIALKVLRKLKSAGIVDSVKGAEGGYRLACDAERLSILDIIESIDGKVYISKCLDDCHYCSLNGFNKTNCKVHMAFQAINKELVEGLSRVTVKSITDSEISALDIIEKIKN